MNDFVDRFLLSAELLRLTEVSILQDPESTIGLINSGTQYRVRSMVNRSVNKSSNKLLITLELLRNFSHDIIALNLLSTISQIVLETLQNILSFHF